MAKPGAYISDVQLLERLDERIGSSGQAMANIGQNVVSYLNDVRDTLERQLDLIRGKLQEAEQRLSEAESACSACHASQVCDEFGMVFPSCESEENEVEVARMEVEKWKERYEQGQRICEECQREIGEYNGPGGGHNLILAMSEQQTPKASQILRGCIDKLHDILTSNMVSSVNLNTTSAPVEGGISLSGDGRVNDMKNFFNM